VAVDVNCLAHLPTPYLQHIDASSMCRVNGMHARRIAGTSFICALDHTDIELRVSTYASAVPKNFTVLPAAHKNVRTSRPMTLDFL
jgi:hypothetical protein